MTFWWIAEYIMCEVNVLVCTYNYISVQHSCIIWEMIIYLHTELVSTIKRGREKFPEHFQKLMAIGGLHEQPFYQICLRFNEKLSFLFL